MIRRSSAFRAATCCGGIFFLSALHAASPPALESTTGMVVTAQHEASEVGAAILRQGGNAIDAAVAVGYALAVTHPCCGNIGGGGFMVIHLADGRNTFLNFRERAPLGASAGMFLDERGNAIAAKSMMAIWLWACRAQCSGWKLRARSTARCRAPCSSHPRSASRPAASY
jgi:gamma-glutamyltranspeptidase/glutathione hydrolase